MIPIKACGVWCKNGRTGALGVKDLVLSLHLFIEGNGTGALLLLIFLALIFPSLQYHVHCLEFEKNIMKLNIKELQY